MNTSLRINSEDKVSYVSVLPNNFTVVFSSGFRLELTAKQIERIIELRTEDIELSAWLNEKHLERLARQATEKFSN